MPLDRLLHAKRQFLAGSALLALSITLLSSQPLAAQNSTPSQQEVVRLWPGDAPGSDKLSDAFRKKLVDAEAKNTPDRTFGVSVPTMTVHPAPAKTANGTAVVVFPGGGYNILAWDHEGRQIAQWLNTIGVHAFVVTYRVPRRDGDHALPPLQDAQRAIRLVRARATDMQFDPDRIGALGFSAGGNLTINAGTRYAERTYAKVDANDELSCRPDFMVPIYAAYLGSPDDDRVISKDLPLSADTPPTFLAVTQDDKNRGIHSAELFAALTRAGVKAEVHVYTKGGHGYGIRESDNPVSKWHHHCEAWMRTMGWLTK